MASGQFQTGDSDAISSSSVQKIEISIPNRSRNEELYLREESKLYFNETPQSEMTKTENNLYTGTNPIDQFRYEYKFLTKTSNVHEQKEGTGIRIQHMDDFQDERNFTWVTVTQGGGPPVHEPLLYEPTPGEKAEEKKAEEKKTEEEEEETEETSLSPLQIFGIVTGVVGLATVAYFMSRKRQAPV